VEENLLSVQCDSNTIGRLPEMGQEARARMDEDQRALRYSDPTREIIIYDLEETKECREIFFHF
jgi:hypothetical protein